MSNFKPIKSDSGHLVSARYDTQTGTLFVKFKGGKVHKYPDFPIEKYQDFENRFDGSYFESAGTYFYREIRHLPNEKVEE